MREPRIVSVVHCATSQIDPPDDFVIASIASLARRPDLARTLAHDEGRVVVIGEAHRAPAKSYREILDLFRTKRSWQVLGLTATPTRTSTEERPVLAKLFGKRILYRLAFTN
jgi:superfamily II DNA or RNA helicase